VIESLNTRRKSKFALKKKNGGGEPSKTHRPGLICAFWGTRTGNRKHGGDQEKFKRQGRKSAADKQKLEKKKFHKKNWSHVICQRRNPVVDLALSKEQPCLKTLPARLLYEEKSQNRGRLGEMMRTDSTKGSVYQDSPPGREGKGRQTGSILFQPKN